MEKIVASRLYENDTVLIGVNPVELEHLILNKTKIVVVTVDSGSGKNWRAVIDDVCYCKNNNNNNKFDCYYHCGDIAFKLRALD